MWNGVNQGDNINKEKRIHPTQKPVYLYEKLLLMFANEGDLILDTHVGSGSSIIACHKHKFKVIGFEINKNYYNLSAERIKDEISQMTIYDYI